MRPSTRVELLIAAVPPQTPVAGVVPRLVSFVCGLNR